MKKLVCLGLAVCLLAGFSGCGPEYGGTTAEVTEAVSEPFEHTITQRIHDSLPEFEFTLYGDTSFETYESEWDGYSETVNGIISAIEISGEDFHQRLEFEFEFFWGYYKDYDHRRLFDYEFLFFEDYTNDGFLDFKLYQQMNRNGPSMFWLWDKEKHEFVDNEQLREINLENRYAISVDDDGRISSWWQKWNADYYEYIDGIFVKVESFDSGFEDDDDGRYWFEQTRKLINGEMKVVSYTREKVEDQSQ